MVLRHTVVACVALVAATCVGAAETTSSAASSPASKTAAGTARSIETGPALGWVFPVFTDKEGFHLLTLRGSAARFITANQIEVTDFSAFSFSGDAAERIETVLLSPKASFFPRENRASGDSTVRLIHDDIEVIGRNWTYDRTKQRVTIEHDTRVTFNAQLNDILK